MVDYLWFSLVSEGRSRASPPAAAGGLGRQGVRRATGPSTPPPHSPLPTLHPRVPPLPFPYFPSLLPYSSFPHLLPHLPTFHPHFLIPHSPTFHNHFLLHLISSRIVCSPIAHSYASPQDGRLHADGAVACGVTTPNFAHRLMCSLNVSFSRRSALGGA